MKIIRDICTKVNASLQITSKAAAGKQEDAQSVSIRTFTGVKIHDDDDDDQTQQKAKINQFEHCPKYNCTQTSKLKISSNQ